MNNFSCIMKKNKKIYGKEFVFSTPEKEQRRREEENGREDDKEERMNEIRKI